MPPTSSLARLIADAKSLWENFVLNNLQMELLFNGMHLDRIADAMSPLHTHPSPKNIFGVSWMVI
jgi:hypothetical protein